MIFYGISSILLIERMKFKPLIIFVRVWVVHSQNMSRKRDGFNWNLHAFGQKNVIEIMLIMMLALS